MKYPGFPQIAGRVSRLKDKRIGRFGWKSQTASLSDFVLTACAVELGLEVPAHHQAGSPQHPDAKPTGFDLNAQECESLVAYVSDLPRPSEPSPRATEKPARSRQAGRCLRRSAARPATCRSSERSTDCTATFWSTTSVRRSATSDSTACSTRALQKKKSSMTRPRSPMRPPPSDAATTAKCLPCLLPPAAPASLARRRRRRHPRTPVPPPSVVVDAPSARAHG